MRWQVISAAAWLLPLCAVASAPSDSRTLDAQRPHQVFMPPSPHPLGMGFMEGDDVPYMTHDGALHGKPFYLELHGNRLRIQSGKRAWSRDLSRAIKPHHQTAMRLDPRGVDLYIADTAGQRPSVACLESLPAEVQRTQPHRTVFVIIDPLHAPRLYQLPSLHAACADLTWSSAGGWQAPWWQTPPEAHEPRLPTLHARLTPSGFVAIDPIHFALIHLDGNGHATLVTAQSIPAGATIDIQSPDAQSRAQCCKRLQATDFRPVTADEAQVLATDELHAKPAYTYTTRIPRSWAEMPFVGAAAVGFKLSTRLGHGPLTARHAHGPWTQARICASQEGVHLTEQVAKQAGQALRTHLYLSLGYELAPSADCPPTVP